MSSTSLDVMPRCSQRASVAGQLLDVREERDHVVLGGALDLLDASRVEHELLVPDAPRGAPGDDAGLFHRIAGGELHLEPHLIAALGGPQSERSDGV